MISKLNELSIDSLHRENAISRVRDNLLDSIINKREELLRESISYAVGNDNWTIADVERRGSLVAVQDSGIETFYFDGIPLVEFHTIKSHFEENKITSGYKFRKLYTPLGKEKT